jgi:hypothetical protein
LVDLINAKPRAGRSDLECSICKSACIASISATNALLLLRVVVLISGACLVADAVVVVNREAFVGRDDHQLVVVPVTTRTARGTRVTLAC